MVSHFLSRVLFFFLFLLAAAPHARAVAVPANYQNTSWITDGVPVAISNGPLNPTATISFNPGRNIAQTFTTANAFTLDKIWIAFTGPQNGSQTFQIEIKVFEVTNTTATTLTVGPNLFSQPQIHTPDAAIPNNLPSMFVAYDVENLALKANQGYAIYFDILSGTSLGLNYAYQWQGYSSGTTFPGGVLYINGNRSSTQGDQSFALQPFVATAVAAPEPASGMLMLMASFTMARRRHRG